MPVRVMHVRHMRMGVLQPAVRVGMGVRLPRRIAGAVRVPMMLVVHVRMGVLHRLVDVLVLVPLGQMQPDAERHQAARRGELHGEGLAERQHRDGCAEERRV